MRQREYVVALREENIELREKITKLESAENIKQNLIFRDGRYYLKKRKMQRMDLIARDVGIQMEN